MSLKPEICKREDALCIALYNANIVIHKIYILRGSLGLH